MTITRCPALLLGMVLLTVIPVSPFPKPDAGRAVPAPPMRAERAAHSATTLADGRVLLAGGFVTPGAPTGAELFDPAAGRLQALPPMVETRHSHSATRLRDGRVLLVGGYVANGAITASAELYDPMTRRFFPAGRMAVARAGHVAVLLADGRVLLAGGVGQHWTFFASAELYDPATGHFTPTGAMAVARESHVGVRLPNGRVLVVGGHRGRRADIVLHATAELYDPNTGSFHPTGSMTVRRHKHDAVLLADGRVLVTGGADERDDRGVYQSTEFYHAGTGRFSGGPSMRLGRYKHAGSSLVVAGGRVLIAGGAARAEVFEPTSGRFLLVEGPPRLAGQFSAVAPLPNGGALISGGYGNGGGPRAAMWRYQP
jgi:hypothetical protein